MPSLSYKKISIKNWLYFNTMLKKSHLFLVSFIFAQQYQLALALAH